MLTENKKYNNIYYEVLKLKHFCNVNSEHITKYVKKIK